MSRQEPCAGGRRWIEVTRATVSCRGCGYRTNGALHTLALCRGGRKGQKRMEKVGEKEKLRRQKKTRLW